MNLDTILGPVTITEGQADTYVTHNLLPPGPRQGADGGRRTAADQTQLYASLEFQIVTGEGRPFGTPVVKAYTTDGPGADDDAIEHFRRGGCWDHRCACGGHDKEA